MLFVWAFVFWTNISTFGLVALLNGIYDMVALLTITVMTVFLFDTCVASSWDANIFSLFTGQSDITVREWFSSTLIETITILTFFC
jgi:hypothetical protein